MFKKVKAFAKKLAKKIKEVVKHIVEKAEERIMSNEELGLKKMEFVVDTAKDIAKGTGKAIKNVGHAIKNVGHAVYDNPVFVMVAGVGVGAAIIANETYKNHTK